METILVSHHPLDWFGGNLEFGREFLMGALCLLADLWYSHFACCIDYIFSCLHSPTIMVNIRVVKYSSDCISMTVLVMVAAQRVAMDTSCHDDRYPAPSTVRDRLPSSIVDEFNNHLPHIDTTFVV